MLVLSRKKGEQIRIGDDVTITIHRISGNRVSIGIEAPGSCRIVRGELQTIGEELQVAIPAEAAAAAPRRMLNPTNRSTRNVPADAAGENRIASHMPQLLRSAK